MGKTSTRVSRTRVSIWETEILENSSRAIGLNAPRDRLLRIFSNFQNRACCEGYLKGNNHNSLHFARKHAQVCVLGHYLFLDAHSLPRATLSEKCSLLGTDNVRRQISENIFAPNGGYCLYIKSLTRILTEIWSNYDMVNTSLYEAKN